MATKKRKINGVPSRVELGKSLGIPAPVSAPITTAATLPNGLAITNRYLPGGVPMVTGTGAGGGTATMPRTAVEQSPGLQGLINTGRASFLPPDQQTIDSYMAERKASVGRRAAEYGSLPTSQKLALQFPAEKAKAEQKRAAGIPLTERESYLMGEFRTQDREFGVTRDVLDAKGIKTGTEDITMDRKGYLANLNKTFADVEAKSKAILAAKAAQKSKDDLARELKGAGQSPYTTLSTGEGGYLINKRTGESKFMGGAKPPVFDEGKFKAYETAYGKNFVEADTVKKIADLQEKRAKYLKDSVRYATELKGFDSLIAPHQRRLKAWQDAMAMLNGQADPAGQAVQPGNVLPLSDFIEDFKSETGQPPTVEQIAKAQGKYWR